jgi:Domain of unknown function (DUF4390)
MRSWKNILSGLMLLLLAACAPPQDTATFAVRTASIDHAVLAAQLDWQPNEVLLDALDHGIALDFSITLKAQAPTVFGWQRTLAQTHWHRELRYFLLTRQYQLRDLDQLPGAGVQTRSYPARASLIAAITDLRLSLPAAWPVDGVQRYSLRIDLERDNLPGALRLPALIDADWRLSTGSYTWQVPPNAG